MAEHLLIAFMMVASGINKCAAAADDNSVRTEMKIQAHILLPTSVEVSWSLLLPAGVGNWNICIHKTITQDWQLCHLLPSDTNKHIFTNLTSRTAYHVYLDFLDTNKTRFSSRTISVAVALPDIPQVRHNAKRDKEIHESNGNIVPPVKTSGTNLSTPDWQGMSHTDYKSLASRVASEQRKGMLYWILIIGSAGLGLIIILSTLTVLYHRLLGSSAEVQMRETASQNQKSNTRVIPKSHDKSLPPEIAGDDNKGGKTASFFPRPYRAVDSVISWGSEFDTIDGLTENIYSNDNPVADTAANDTVLASSVSPGLLSYSLTVKEASDLTPGKFKTLTDRLFFKGRSRSYEVSHENKAVYSNVDLSKTSDTTSGISKDQRGENVSNYANTYSPRIKNPNFEIYANDIVL